MKLGQSGRISRQNWLARIAHQIDFLRIMRRTSGVYLAGHGREAETGSRQGPSENLIHEDRDNGHRIS